MLLVVTSQVLTTYHADLELLTPEEWDKRDSQSPLWERNVGGDGRALIMLKGQSTFHNYELLQQAKIAYARLLLTDNTARVQQVRDGIIKADTDVVSEAKSRFTRERCSSFATASPKEPKKRGGEGDLYAMRARVPCSYMHPACLYVPQVSSAAVYEQIRI